MIRRLLTSPLALLGAFALVAVVLLMLPIRLPLGPNYWDLFTYVDTAYRMKLGQLPSVDFFVPVGPLGYGLYVALTSVFTQAHTLLAVQYSMLLIALPVMAMIASQAAKKSRQDAVLLVIPFILFGLLPINVIELYPSPGFDGFGNYNRHTALLLYVLASALLFVESRSLAGILAILIGFALFLTKITGFVIGAVLILLALVTGRIGLRWVLITLAALSFPVFVLELRTTMISHYLSDIVELIGLNTGSILPRILTVLSLKLNVVLPAILLIGTVGWLDRQALCKTVSGIFESGRPESGRLESGRLAAFKRFLDHDSIWLLALLVGGMVFETQNTGSHEFILLWPGIVMLMRRYPLPWNMTALPVVVLAAIVVLPTPVTVVHRAIRAIISMPKYEPVAAPLLGPIGRVSAKSEIMLQSRALLAHYADSRASFERITKRNVLPSYILFSEIDFQIGWLVSTQQAAEALLQYEADAKIRLEKIVTLDFVDPLPFMLNRTPLRDLSIGNDPERTLAKLGAHVIAEVKSADAILVPLCPPTTARNTIFSAYARELEGRRTVALTPCFNMLVKN
jgi:hypothetical protein